METKGKYEIEALEYISKLSEGGMRDAISLMDKCLAYNPDLTLENVVVALGTVDYDVMFELTDSIINNDVNLVIEQIEDIYNSGKDLKTFIKQYLQFILDIEKYNLGCDWKYLNIPKLENYKKWMIDNKEIDIENLLDKLTELNSDIKYSATPKVDIEIGLILLMGDEVFYD